MDGREDVVSDRPVIDPATLGGDHTGFRMWSDAAREPAAGKR
jgi:hypothetical protein